MGYLKENHPRELYEILKVLDILADCGVKESREGYFISPEEEKSGYMKQICKAQVNVF